MRKTAIFGIRSSHSQKEVFRILKLGRFSILLQNPIVISVNIVRNNNIKERKIDFNGNPKSGFRITRRAGGVVDTGILIKKKSQLILYIL